MEDAQAEIDQASAAAVATDVRSMEEDGVAGVDPAGTEEVDTNMESEATPDSNIAASSPASEDDNVSTSSDTSTDPMVENDDGDNIDSGVSPEEAEGLVIKATELKEQGNQHFSAQERDEAVRCYRRGLHRLKKLKHGPVESLDPQVAALFTTLSTNLSTVLFQQAKYNASQVAASQALEVTPMHVKALYRRAVAARKLGNTEQALGDLQTALTVEPTHAACRKELRSLQQAVAKAKANQKKALAKAFSGGVSLYDDKQGPPSPEEIAAALAAEKQKWEDECVARMARNEPAVSFKEWQAEQKEAQKKAEEAAKKEEEERKKREKAERQKRLAEKRAKKAGKENDGSSSEEELTEAELQALRGYKKTKDGRVTSYFTREVSDHVPHQAPQKLTTTPVVTSPSPIPETAAPLKKGPSAWNRAGTWEEKDCTEWCRDRLRTRLGEVRTSSFQIIKVDSLTGEASVVWTNGKQRRVFDFHVTLHYYWTAGASAEEDGKKKPKGVVKLPDISSTSAHEDKVEVVFDGWKRAPASADMSRAMADRPALEKALHEAVQAWLKDFHEQYHA
jgi:tetratricopeptide (TPR) repeat protein